MREVQVSASISETTKELFEREVRATGVKKGFLIENALLHHLSALRELPTEFIIPPRLVVNQETGDRILERLDHPEPTPALRDLMRGD